VGKSSLLVRLTDQRFLNNPDPTVRACLFTLGMFIFEYSLFLAQLGVEFGSKLIEIADEGKVVKLQCTFRHRLPW
jgi:Ras-related protein Rab-2A